MKRLVSVSAFVFSIKHQSCFYIYQYNDYDINCEVISQNIGILGDRYTLKLEGTAENIQMFLDYLKCEGFKIK